MALEIKSELRLSQRLVLSPQVRQSLEILQLAKLDLEQRIKEELELNPLLDLDEEAVIQQVPSDGELEGNSYGPTKRLEEAFKEADWDVLSENLFHLPRSVPSGDDDGPDLENTLSYGSTLRDYLVNQLYMQGLDDEGISIGFRIIGNIDDDGILRVPLESIFSGDEMDKALQVLEVIQGFDPPGVGARSVSEALLIQARDRGAPDNVISFIEGFGSYLDSGDARSFIKALDDREDREEILSWLSSLDPKPGSRLSGEGDIHYVTPDVLVVEMEGRFEVFLNKEGIPSLRLNRRYIELLKRGVDRLTEDFIKSKMKSAISFMKMLEQRESTLLNVARSIVRFQEGFLREGERALKPLTLRDVAEDVGLHESTVSRVVSNKYMGTPRGVFPMKFFFGGSLTKGGVGSVSTKAVKTMIAEIIEGEDRSRPLSDSEIQRILLERGIRIARRTVAKYRESMGIPPKDMRRLKNR